MDTEMEEGSSPSEAAMFQDLLLFSTPYPHLILPDPTLLAPGQADSRSFRPAGSALTLGEDSGHFISPLVFFFSKQKLLWLPLCRVEPPAPVSSHLGSTPTSRPQEVRQEERPFPRVC